MLIDTTSPIISKLTKIYSIFLQETSSSPIWQSNILISYEYDEAAKTGRIREVCIPIEIKVYKKIKT